MEHPPESDDVRIIKWTIAIVFGILLLAGALYWSYLYSRTQPGGLVFPGGTTYLGPSQSPKVD